MQQRCKLCGRADKFNFDVPDDVWRAIVPRPFWHSVSCLACFDYLASARGIDYSIDLLHFAGEKESFTFVPKP